MRLEVVGLVMVNPPAAIFVAEAGLNAAGATPRDGILDTAQTRDRKRLQRASVGVVLVAAPVRATAAAGS